VSPAVNAGGTSWVVLYGFEVESAIWYGAMRSAYRGLGGKSWVFVSVYMGVRKKDVEPRSKGKITNPGSRVSTPVFLFIVFLPRDRVISSKDGKHQRVGVQQKERKKQTFDTYDRVSRKFRGGWERNEIVVGAFLYLNGFACFPAFARWRYTTRRSIRYIPWGGILIVGARPWDT